MPGILLSAFGLGLSAGLRTFTAPAVLAWAAFLGFIDVSTSQLSFLGSSWFVGVSTLLAVGEYIADLFPQIGNRTDIPALIGRSLSAALCGASIAAAANRQFWPGVLIAVVGAMCGAFGGFSLRQLIVKKLGFRDWTIAVPEDFVAVTLAAISILII